MSTMKDAAGETLDIDAENTATEELYKALVSLVEKRLPMHGGVFTNAAKKLLIAAIMFSDDPGKLAEHMAKRLVADVADCLEHANSPSSTRQ
jgi:hypothetical protein